MTADISAWWHQVRTAMAASGYCHVCLNHLRSRLHHEICEVKSSQARPRQREHGTDSGYNGHILDGSPPCQPCSDARATARVQQRARKRAATPATATEEAA